MVALSQNPSIREVIAFKLARKLTQAEKAEYVNRARAISLTIIKLMLHIVGFSCFTLAGFSVSTTAGLIAATISCFAMSWLVTSPPRSTEDKMSTFERMNRE